MNIFHIIKRDEILENVGKNMPMIYANLDNRKGDYQTNMIEVEG